MGAKEAETQTQRDALGLGPAPQPEQWAQPVCVLGTSPHVCWGGRLHVIPMCGHHTSSLSSVCLWVTCRPMNHRRLQEESSPPQLTSSFQVRNGRLREGSASWEVTQQVRLTTRRPWSLLWALTPHASYLPSEGRRTSGKSLDAGLCPATSPARHELIPEAVQLSAV